MRGVVTGSDEVVVIASHVPVRISEGPSHAPESALVAICTGKHQDAGVAFYSSDFIVAPPSESIPTVFLTLDDAVGVGVRHSTRPHKKLKSSFKVFKVSTAASRACCAFYHLQR